MDLGAYIQMNDLEPIAKANGIEIPRLRGLRLMRDELPLTDEDLKLQLDDARHQAYEKIMESDPPFSLNPKWFSCDEYTRRRIKKYLIRKTRTAKRHSDGSSFTYEETIGIRWNLLHGKKRKTVKYVEKRYVRSAKKQYSLWNQYAQREDVLYIHAKIGGWNWSDSHWSHFQKEPWFLAGVDDWYDPVYCDIYAKIDPKTIKQLQSKVEEEQDDETLK